MDGDEEYVPFFVLPPRGTATAKILFLAPTCSYLAYANSQITQTGNVAQAVIGHMPAAEQVGRRTPRARRVLRALDLRLPLDGRGVGYTSWRRPILNMRPRYRHEYGAIHQFPADLYLTDWLNAERLRVRRRDRP